MKVLRLSPKIRKAFCAVFHMCVLAGAFAVTDHTDAGFRTLCVIFLCLSLSCVTVTLLCLMGFDQQPRRTRCGQKKTLQLFVKLFWKMKPNMLFFCSRPCFHISWSSSSSVLGCSDDCWLSSSCRGWQQVSECKAAFTVHVKRQETEALTTGLLCKGLMHS